MRIIFSDIVFKTVLLKAVPFTHRKNLFLFLLFIISFISPVLSQESTLNNISGNWIDNSIWSDNSNPGVNNIAPNCTIYGNVRRIGDLDFGNGDLIVNDTLTIYGNLVLGNNADLTINSGGVLIVYGDYISGNQVMAIAGGYLVVTGNLDMQGADDQGSFDVTSGAVFVLDPTPIIKTGAGYVDLICTDPNNYPIDCGFGNLTNLNASPISSLFTAGAYTLSVSGSTTFCTGGSVVLSVPNDGSNYQWYNNGVAIAGATSFTYTASVSGNYYLTFLIGAQNITTNTISVTVNTLSIVPLSATRDVNNVCPGTNVTLSYAGGTLGTGAIAKWYSDAGFTILVGTGNNLIIAAPSSTTTYYVRFEGPCNTTAAVNTILSVTPGGNYRTNGTGARNWSVVANWQRWNGVAWVAATAYPGQNACAGTVTILNNTVLTLDVNPANPIGNLVFDDLTINATSLNITGRTLNVSGAVTFGNPNAAAGSQTLTVATGTLNCASVTMPETGVNTEILTLSVTTGTINTSGSVLMNTSTPARNVITYTGVGAFNIGGAFSGGGTFNKGTGTVNFNGTGTQNVGPFAYNNLAFTNNSIKTLLGNSSATGTFTINNNATFNLGILATTFSVTGVATINGNLDFGGTSTKTVSITGNLSGLGTIDMSGGSFLHVLNLGGATNSIGTFTTAAVSSQVNYNSGAAQTVFASLNYRNLTISGGGIKTLQGNVNINGNLNVSAGTLDLGTVATVVNVSGTTGIAGTLTFGTAAKTMSLTGNLSGAGTINMTGAGLAHTLNLLGPTNSITTFTTTAASGSTVNYSALGDQSVFASANYINLIISGSGIKTLQASSTIGGTLTLNSSFDITGKTLTLNGPTIAGTPLNLLTDAASNLVFGGVSASVLIPSHIVSLTGLTTSNTNIVTLQSSLTLSGLFSPGGAGLSIGANTLTLNGQINCGVLVGGASSNIIIGGAGTASLSAVSLNNLIINRPAGVTMCGNVTAAGTITLTSGALSIAANMLTLSNAGNLSYGGGSLSGGTTSNLTIGTGTIITLNTIAGGLNNFNVSRNINLGASLSINGILTLTSGTFAVGANTLTLNGPTIAGTPNNLSVLATSNLIYGGSSAGVNIPASVVNLGNLSINNTNGVTMNSTITLAPAGVLTLTDGIIQAGANILKVTNTAIAGIVGGSASAFVNIGSGSIERTIPSGIVALGQNYLFPIGEGGVYKAINIRDIITGATGPVLRAKVSPAGAITGDGVTMGTVDPRYWTLINTNSGNFNSGKIELFESGLDLSKTIGMSLALAGNYSAIGGSSNVPSIVSPNLLNPGVYYCIGTAITETYYSYQTGTWNTPNTWTTDPSGTLQIGGTIPGNDDKVIILTGRTVSLSSDISTLNLDITIDAGGFLDQKIFRFTNSIYALRGQGTFILASANIPVPVVNTFIDAGAGTFEYNNSANFTFPASYPVYNNLVLNSNGFIGTQLSNISLNGYLNVKTGTFRINDNASVAKLNLTVNGNVNVDNAGLISVGNGVTNPLITAVSSGGVAPFINYYTYFHTVIIRGDFTNNGTVKFTNLNYPIYNAFPPTANGPTSGAASVYFQGSSDNTLNCNGVTNFYNLIIDKGTDQTNRLIVNSSDYNNFKLFGANTLAGEASGSNANLRKALWIRTGTLVLRGTTIIPSLTEGVTAGSPNSDFYIPSNGALVLDGPEVIILSTADDYREINSAYNVTAPDNATIGITSGGNSALNIFGKLQINNGFLSTRESGGLITSNIASGQFIINDGVVDAKQFLSATGFASYTQTGGSLLLRGRFRRTPVSYTISGLADITLSTLNTSRAINGVTSANGSFNLNNTTNIFAMSGGTIRIYDVCGIAAGEQKAFDVFSSNSNINVTGGSLEIIPIAGTALADAANYRISSSAPLNNLLIDRQSSASVVQLNTSILTVIRNLTLSSGDFNANNLDVRIGGDFMISIGTSYTTGTNTTFFNGTSDQTFTVNLAAPLSLNKLTIDKPANIALNFAGSQPNINISDNFRLVLATMNDNGNTIRIAKNVFNSGIHSGTGTVVLNGTVLQTIDGNGIFGNLELNNTTIAVPAPVSLLANCTINGALTFSQDKLFNINTYNLKLNGNASIVNASALRYVKSAGNAGDGGITKVFSAPLSFNFPVGVNNYTPGSIGLNSVPTSYGSITVVPVNYAHPNATTSGRSLSYFWRVNSSGFNLGSATVTHGYIYNQSNVITGAGITEDEYVAAKYNSSTSSWSRGTSADVDDATNNIIGEPGSGSFLENVSFIDGDFTAGDDNPTNPFGAPTIFYSRQSGLWSTLSTWSLTSNTVTNPPLTVPGANDIVIIGDADSVYLTTNSTVANTGSASCATLQIESGSALDIGYNPSSIFYRVMSHPNGNGNFRVTTNFTSPSTFIFPSGDFSDFNVNRGTTELYTTNPASGTEYYMPVGVASYGNLILSPLGGSNLMFSNNDITIYGNLITRGQNADSWFCPSWGVTYPGAIPAIAKTISIKGNLDIQGGALIWYNNAAIAQNFVIDGNLRIAALSSLYILGGTNQSMAIGGSLINNANGGTNGTSTTSKADFTGIPLTFFGSTSSSVTSTAGSPVTIFSTVTVNKGTSQATTLTCDIAGTLTTPVNAWLNLQNGTFRFMRTNPGADFNISTTTPFIIPSTAGLYIDLPSNTGNRNIMIGNVANNAGDLLLDGKLTLIRGNIYIGPTAAPANNNDIEYSGGGASSIEVQGGNLFVNGQIRRNTSTTNGILKYIQSGGVVTINGNAANASYAKLEILNAGSLFNMSGGTLTIVNGDGTVFGDLYLRPASSAVTGGTIVFSHNFSGSPQSYLLESTANLFNITVTGRTAATAANAALGLMVSPLAINGSLTLTNANSLFNCNSKNLSIKGDLINNGPLAPVAFITGTNTTTFNGGIQSISGARVSNFNNLTVSSLNSLTVNNSFTVNQNLTIGTGSLILGNKKVTVYGDLTNNGAYTDDNTVGGVSLSGTVLQQIYGTGAYGRLEINNNSGASLNNDIMLQNDLLLTLGIFKISSNLLTLSQNSKIIGTPSATKMILSDGVTSSFGVRKFFTAAPQSFTFPIGVAGKYTPASYTITANGSVGYINVNPINNNHPSTLDPSNVLKYYWQIESSGISGFNGDLLLQYLPADIQGVESNYVAAYLEIPGNYWYTATPGPATDNVNETTHRISFNSAASNNLSGDYTAGIESAFPVEIPVYQTNQDGNWSDNLIWTPVGSSPPCPVGGPNGSQVIIDHIVSTDVNNCFAFRTTINNKLKIISPTFGHNLGVVDGEGTLYLENGNLPAGNFTSFIDCSGNATVEYGGTGAYTIVASQFNSLPNMLFTGTGIRTLPNKDLTICKRLVIDGPMLDNNTNNRKLTILGSMERYNSGAFAAGTGLSPAATVSISGSAIQTIGGPTGDFTGSNSFNNLEINNSQGLKIGVNGLIEVNNSLLLTEGIIKTTTSNKLVLLNTSASAAIPSGGRATSYINGPLTKKLLNGGSFQYPIGNDTIIGHNFTLTSTTSGNLSWTVEYFSPNSTSGSITAPLIETNTKEYWGISTTTNATAKVKIGWNPQSSLTPVMTINGIADMRVAEFNAGFWNQLLSSASGNNNIGDVITTNNVNISTIQKNYTTASITTTRARASFSPIGAICGSSGIPVNFSSYTPINLNYTLSYTLNGLAQPIVAISSLPYLLPTPVPGNYQLTGFTYNNGANTGVVGDTIITALTMPTTSNAGPDQSLCGFSGTTLAGNNPAPYTGLWTVVSGAGGNFVNNTLRNTVFTGTLGVTYSLKWSISNSTCTSSDNVVIAFPVVAARPSNFLLAPTSVCRGVTGYVYSVPAVLGITYTWSYSGTGHTINGTGNSVTVDFNATATSGTLSVTATNACATSLPRTTGITVNPAANLVITNPAAICSPGIVNLTAAAVTSGSSAGLTYTYWTNATATVSLVSPSAVTTSGTYYIKGTTVSGCFDIKPVTVTINALPATPTITASGPLTFCAGGSVTLTSSAGSSYLWSTGATTASINVTTAGSYTVQVTNASGCQSASSVATAVTVNALPATPTITASGPLTFCSGGSVTLTSSAGSGYLWSTGETTASINVTTAGSFTVQVTNASGCQSVSSITTTISLNTPPVASTASVTVQPNCAVSTGTIEVSAPVGSYEYSIDAGVFQSSTTFSSVASGSHSIIVRNSTDYTCVSNATNVTVNSQPLPSIAPTAANIDRNNICPNDGSILLSYLGGFLGTGSIAEWYSDAAYTTNVGSGNNISISAPSSTTTYFVRFEGGCITTASVSATITIKSLSIAPVAAVDRNNICPNDGNIILTYSGGFSGTGAISKWYADAGFASNIGNGNNLAISTPAISQTYYIRFEGDCNSTSAASINLIVKPSPSIGFTGLSSPVCQNTTSQLLVGDSAPEGVFSGTSVTDNSNGTATFSTSLTGTFSIKYVVTNLAGCTDSSLQTVIVNAIPVVSFSGLAAFYPITSPLVTLTGTPAGGVFTGKGISGNTYSPVLAGIGSDTVRYSFTNGSGCSAEYSQITSIGDYDSRAGAYTVPHTSVWTSALAIFTTVGATADQGKGSLWSNGPNYNRWFKFQATTSQVKVDLKVGGAEGTMQNPFLALWNNAGAELQSAVYYNSTSDISVSSLSLIPGDWYYISVDNYVGAGYCGSFTLALDTQVDYDFREAAMIIPHSPGWCSANAAFSTLNATADQTMGSVWPNGPNYNRWFKFQATTSQVKVDLKVGGIEGSLQNPLLALWNNSGTEIQSINYYNSTSDVSVSSLSLVPGDWYYVSVDNYVGTGYRGTFTLCLDTQVDYDYREAAVVLPHSLNWCSADAAYTTLNATNDQTKGSVWPNGPNYNRWFKFQATTGQVKVDLKVGAAEGSMQNPLLALWDNAGAEIQSAAYYNSTSDITVSSISLVPGDWYYISVDNYVGAGYRGTFTLCLTTQVDYDFRDAALVVPHSSGWCSADGAYTTLNATADQSKGSIWPNGPNYNRWFKFQATTAQVKVDLKVGGSEGSLQNPLLALLNNAGVEIQSATYYNTTSDISVSSINLIPGDWYYICVDNYIGTGYRGTFTLCVDTQVDYDYREAAMIVPHSLNWCSTDAAFSTLNATADQSKGSVWPNGPNNNRWFKFQATSAQVKVDLKVGAAEGSMQNPLLALWSNAGVEIKSAAFYNSTSDITVSSISLAPGDWYYISVDNFTGLGYRGTFTLCLTTQVDYDFREAAMLVPHTGTWCSADAAYSTLNATADQAKGSIWPNGPNYNRWFKFQASTKQVKVNLKVGAGEGSMQNPLLALWNNSGTEIQSAAYFNSTSDIEVSSINLVLGDWYFISVDNYVGDGYRGTFTLCVDTAVNYDYQEGALIVPHTGNWCSANAAYTTLNATADQSKGSLWPNGPNYNRWFKFQATTTQVKVDLKVGGAEGSMQNPLLALWNNAGTELQSSVYFNSTSDINVSSVNLIPGDYYYISVDNYQGTGYRGTFTLCVDDSVDYDYREGATQVTQSFNWCSANSAYTTINATADRTKGIAWNSGPNYNRWFKFQANSTNITATLNTGGIEGSLQYGYIALFNTNNIELASARYTVSTSDIAISTDSLILGNWYYIVVDNLLGAGYRGTFTLCISSPLTASITGTDITCNSSNDGTASVLATGGTGAGYSYTWTRNGSAIAPVTAALSGLSPGIYAVVVKDIGNGTTATKSITVIEPSALALSLTQVNETCPGNSNGSILTTVSGGKGMGYLYEWFRNGVPSGVIASGLTNLDPALYKVIVTDAAAPGCSKTDSIQIITSNSLSTNPTGISIANNNICQGTPKTLAVTGGTLGSGASWRWYLDVGLTLSAGPAGATLTVDPGINTPYFVRAEGTCNNTLAVSDLVLTGIPSFAPTSAISDRNNICSGDGNIILSYSGGSLGDGAIAEWYSDAAFATNIGTGNNLTISAPLITAVYYIRFEGDCNITSAASVTVIIQDITIPIALCQNLSISLDGTGNATITPAMINNGSTDNCTAAGSLTLLLSKSTFDCANVGANNITLSVTDASGNSSTCTSTVTVSDNTAPAAVCQNLSINLDGTGNATITPAMINNGSSDNCTAAGSLTLALSKTTFDCTNLGANTVTLTVTDASGNISTCTSTVTLSDNTAPTALCQNLSINLDGTGNATITPAMINNGSSDNCTAAGSLTLALSKTTFNCANVGANNITLTVTDASGNSSNCTAVVTVLHDIAPVSATSDRNNICALDGNIILSYAGGAPGTGSLAKWYSDALFTVNVGTGNNIVVPAPSVTTVYYVRIEGVCGNGSSVSTTLNINPLPVPVIVGPSEVCDPANENYTVSFTAGHSYSWTISGGTISGASNTNSVLANWVGTGAGTLQISEVIDATGCQQTTPLFNVAKFATPVLLDIDSNNKLTRR